MLQRCSRFLLATALSLIASTSRAEPAIVVLPDAVSLNGAADAQQLLVQREEGQTLLQELADGVEWSVADPGIARISRAGVVTPVSDGETTVTASRNGLVATARVRVRDALRSPEWSFAGDVLPILSKAGCNMGACHGALAGKGGFRLSLRGYDPQADHFNIVKQDRGRRVEFSDPGRSLILAKPSGGLPHKGGLRIPVDSPEYRVLADWIAGGAAPPADDAPVVNSLEALPVRVTLSPGDSQRMIVLATDSRGRTRDVTSRVIWTSTNEAVCRVDKDGRVQVMGPGEGAVTAWYSSRIAVARITVPFGEANGDRVAEIPAPRNFIDEEIDRQLTRLRLPPSPPCDDATFLRRAFLDTIGLPPTADEVQAFLAETADDKRDQLIETLLARPEFVDYWTYKWSDVLMLNGTLLRPQAIKSYYDWIHDRVARNVPWDEMAREILTARGSSYENGATNFYALFQTPEEMTENASQAFLGLSLACAKCHNHPLEKWTNDQYYAMANLFSRVRSKGWGGEPRNGDGLRTTFVVDAGELVQPRTGKPQPPTPLDAEPIPFDSPLDRREALADWMTSPENPYFARAIANRVWGNYFARGLVEPVDDLRVSNPASNEELLAKAAAFLVQQKFDLKSLMREILRSNAYQRSSVAVAGNEADQRFYSRYFPRRLSAEVLHDSVVLATDAPTRFEQVAFPGADVQKTDFYPLGTRAIQLYDSAVDSYFLQAFGRNPRNIVCECERSNEPSMVQALHLSNGNTINEKLQADGGTVATLVRQLDHGMAVDTLIDTAYLTCLSRYPSAVERKEFLQILEAAPEGERRQVIEDLFWALLSSREFVFNH